MIDNWDDWDDRSAYEYELVLVSYRSRELVAGLLDRLPPAVPIAIVDNADGEDGIDELISGRSNARYLAGGGVGFARAANRGARTSTYDAVIFVNPDSTPSVQQLDSLVADLRRDPGLAAVSAMTVRPDGRVELGVGGWEPSFRRALVYATGAHVLFPTAGLFARPVPGQEVQLDWLSGACLAVRRETFLSLGGFDESFFVYNEDVAFGRRVREAGLRQRMRTDLLVTHLGGGSGEVKTHMIRMRGASMDRYVARHNAGHVAIGIRLVLSMGAIGRYLVCRLTSRADHAPGYAAYLQGLWRGAPGTAKRSPVSAGGN